MSGFPDSGRRFLPGRPFDPPRAVMTPRIFNGNGSVRLQADSGGQIFPANQLIFRNRALRGPADHILQLSSGNARAGTLDPDIFLRDFRAGGDVANRHDAMERHVADVLLARLNLLRGAERPRVCDLR